MTFQELKARNAGRNFDQIVVVVKDIFDEMAELRRIYGAAPGDVRTVTCTTDDGVEFTEKRATYFYINTSLCVIEPVSGETVYKKFLDKHGEGIACVRERIAPDKFDAEEARYTSKGFAPVQKITKDCCKKSWFEMDDLGILFEIISDNSEKITPSYVIQDKIQQINITTPDVYDTIAKIVDRMEIGPFELGAQSPAALSDWGFREDGVIKKVDDFKFIIAIIPCGNIEWEVIQPVTGPLVYNDFIKRRGIGYHHILLEVACANWDKTFETYAANNIELACFGKLGPVDWCYFDTEEQIKFYTEMRTDAVMDKLPDGYFIGWYPEEN